MMKSKSSNLFKFEIIWENNPFLGDISIQRTVGRNENQPAKEKVHHGGDQKEATDHDKPKVRSVRAE